MILCLDDVLDAQSIEQVLSLLAEAEYTEGALTAGWNARSLKRNEQAVHEGAGRRLSAALRGHPVFQQAALPVRISEPLFSRCRQGMGYGIHMDDALMLGRETLRTDLAVTVFLSAPAAYAGGALTLHTIEGAQAYKLEAGQALLYPAQFLHSVETVSDGVRHAAIFWVQSLVRDAADRELLFDLDTARRDTWERNGNQPSKAFDLINRSYSNLLRRWAEP